MLAMVGAGIGGGLFLVTIVLIGELGHEIISELFYFRCNMHGMRG